MKHILKKQLILEGFIDHLKRNKGKYSAGAGLGAGLGATYAAGQGHLGIGPQDFVQDTVGKAMDRLKADAVYDKQLANRDAFIDVYRKPDNILYNDSNAEDYEYQKNFQPGTYSAYLKNVVGDSGKKLVGLDKEPDDTNFIIRNPAHTAGIAYDSASNFIKPWIGLDK